jgi:threonine 3-dehydrogenase
MPTVKALTIDIEKDGWDTSKGFVMRDVPMPVLDEKANPDDVGSVILKIRYAGVCGSDRGLWNRTAFKDLVHDSLAKEKKTLRITGHEFLGEVVEAGSKSGRKKGEVVTGDSHITCGQCLQCKAGETNVCTNEKILGISTDGIFAEFVKIPAKNLWMPSPAIRPEVAAIMDPFGNAVHAVSKTDFKNTRVAIFGCGPVGLFSILLVKHFGASLVVAVDINPANLAMAKALGADETCNANVAVARIMELTGGIGVDVVTEMAGPFSSVLNALDSVRRGGHVILFGIKDGDLTIPSFSRLIMRGITIHCVIGRRIFETWEVSDRVLSDITNGVADKVWNVILKGGTGTVLSFKNFNPTSFEAAMNEHPKVVFKIHG